MNAPRTARERARAELTREIVDAARRQLSEVGAAGLSLRAVSRELGMVSSALHRYFPTRDDLLTALIVEGYGALGDAVEQAEALAPRDDHPARWRAATTAVRQWALAHPHEYALIYGTPVPGYRAPQETVPTAGRTVLVLVRILDDAHAAGRLDVPSGAVTPALRADVVRLREALGIDLPDAALPPIVTAWTGVFGHISFELFGQFENALDARDELFDRTVAALGRLAGLRDG